MTRIVQESQVTHVLFHRPVTFLSDEELEMVIQAFAVSPSHEGKIRRLRALEEKEQREWRARIRKVLSTDLKMLKTHKASFYPVFEDKDVFLAEREKVYRSLLDHHCPGWELIQK